MSRRGERKTLLHRGLTTTVLAGSNTWALSHNDSACGKQHVGVVCLVLACSGARVYQRTKVEKTPLFPQDWSINQTVRNWSRSARRPRGTRSSKCSDDCRSQESEVADVRQTTAKRRLESRTKRPRRQIRVRRCTNSMAWKPLETRPHHVSGARGDSGADASHRQCRHGRTQTKNQPGKGPQNPRKVKEHSQLQAKEHTQQQGKELELLVIRNSAIEKIVKMPGEEWEFFKSVQRQ